jgi:hypothetical protein
VEKECNFATIRFGVEVKSLALARRGCQAVERTTTDDRAESSRVFHLMGMVHEFARRSCDFFCAAAP